jgi:hypothetical protein
MSEDKFGNAAEACKHISSEAEKIAATYKGQAGLIKEVAKMTPWGAVSNAIDKIGAENDIKQQMRNILNIDLSSNDVMEISNTCTQKSTVEQTNTIKWDPACLANPIIAQAIANGTIKLTNIKQRNVAETEQKCIMQALLDVVSKKQASLENLVAAEALSKAEGLGAKNTVSQDTCNIVNKDMSSNDYINMTQSCNNEVFANQTNEIFACSGMEEIVQENLSTQKQECLQKAGVIKASDATAEVSNTTQLSATAEATGVSPLVSSGGAACCVVIIIFCLIKFLK